MRTVSTAGKLDSCSNTPLHSFYGFLLFSYNIAPRTYSPVIRRQGSELILHSMRWGVVPHYSKHEDKSLSTINAKGEHLTEGTSALWNGLKGKKRCVVPVQGYYEWLKKSPTDKVPHFTKYKDEKIMMLAGMWDVVTLEGECYDPTLLHIGNKRFSAFKALRNPYTPSPLSRPILPGSCPFYMTACLLFLRQKMISNYG